MDAAETDIGILNLIASGKNERADWFKEGTHTNRLAVTLAAMANSHGGTLLIGIGPTNKVDGVKNVRGTIDQLLETALSLDPPLIIPIPQVFTVEGKSIINVKIPHGMPNVYSQDGRYVRRDGVKNIGIKPPDLRRLIIERGVSSFEAEVMPTATLDEIDWDKVRNYARQLSALGSEEDLQRLLERRGCLARYDGQLYPTRAGILLFGKDPQRHVRGSEITAARFAGETMSDKFHREDILGTLPDQIRRAETFLTDYLRKGVQLSNKMARTEQLEYPMEAARELVVNAVAHRDYSINGDGIRLFIFRNRMEVSSPGGLAGPVTVDNIKDERFSRNPIIVQVLADMGFIERLGYGVDRVIDLMREQNLHEPEFKETAGGFRVTLHGKEEEDFKSGRKHTSFSALLPNQEIELNPRQEIAVKFLQESEGGRITNSDLQNLCPDVHPETIRRDLADLVSKQVLAKKGKKRGSYYVLAHTTETAT